MNLRDYNVVKKGLGEPQGLNLWKIIVDGDTDNIVEVRAKSLELPEIKYNNRHVKSSGYTFNFAGEIDRSGKIIVPFTEAQDMKVVEFFAKFNEGVFPVVSGYPVAGGVITSEVQKAEVLIQLYKADAKEISWVWSFKDVMCQIQPSGTLSHEDVQNVFEPTVVLVYNTFSMGNSPSNLIY